MKFSKKVEEYYKKQKEKIHPKIKSSSIQKYEFNEDKNKVHTINIIGNDNESLYNSTFRIAGIYNIQASTWTWGYNVDFANKNLTINKNIIKKTLKDIKNEYNITDKEELDKVYFYLSNNSFFISRKNIKDLIKLVLYISQKKWIVSIQHNNSSIMGNNISFMEYILLD